MCSYRVSLTVGHESEPRAAGGADGGFGYYSGETHDWRLYVRGTRGEDISGFVSKIVFTLHRSYTYPKRVIHEPPYEIRESGYGCFDIPIYIYIKHSTNPRKIKFRYKLFLQNHKPLSGSQRFSHIFNDPPELVRSCLIEGGARIVEPTPSATITNIPDMDPVSKVLSVNLSRIQDEQLKRKHFENTTVDSKRRRTEAGAETVMFSEVSKGTDIKNGFIKRDTVLDNKVSEVKPRIPVVHRSSDVRTNKKPHARNGEIYADGDKVSESTAVDCLKKVCTFAEMSVSEVDGVTQLYLSLRRYEKGVNKDSLTLPPWSDPIFRIPELPPSLRGILPEDDDIGGYVLR